MRMRRLTATEKIMAGIRSLRDGVPPLKLLTTELSTLDALLRVMVSDLNKRELDSDEQ